MKTVLIVTINDGYDSDEEAMDSVYDILTAHEVNCSVQVGIPDPENKEDEQKQDQS